MGGYGEGAFLIKDRVEERLMPIYEYRCLKCDEINEFLAGMGPKGDPMICKKCGGEAFQKLMSTSSFKLNVKGEGGASQARCCGSAEVRGDCTPGMCCGGEND